MSATAYPYNLLPTPELLVDNVTAQTTTFNGTARFINIWAGAQAPFKGAYFILNFTAVGTTPTLTAQLQIQDPTSSQWINVVGAVTASIAAISVVSMYVYPGAVETANTRVSASISSRIRFVYTIGGTTPSYSFTNTAILLP